MAVYERSNKTEGDHYEAVFTLIEVPLYGSDRLGMYTPSINDQLAVIPFNIEDFEQVNLDLGKVIAGLPGTETFVAASHDGTSAIIDLALYNDKANYYAFTNNWLNFTGGSIIGNTAIAENENGQAQFYVVPAYTNIPVLMIYNRDKSLMFNSDNISYDDKQVQAARLVGSAYDEFILFTGGTDGKLYYHKIDMALNGGLGDFTAKNQVLDNDHADYNGQMLAIEDQTTGNVKLLTTRLNGNFLHLVKFEISSDINGALVPLELLTTNNSYGAANMKLSPDGKKLLLYHFTGTGVLGVKPAEMLVFNLTGDYKMADATGQLYSGDPAAVPVISQTAIPEGTLANAGAEFSSTGGSIVFSQSTTTGNNVSLLNLTDNTTTTLLANSSGDISLRSDGRMYISATGSNNLHAFAQDMISDYPVTMAASLTGALANKVYKSKSSVETEQTYARLTGLKQYELKDHLGNVRSVVSDLKTATGSGNIPINYANVLAYYNYYPFGMRMPGRYGPADLVGQNGYRYGFNGKEKDDDFGGSTSAIYDYGFRIYDSRIGKFLSVDPLTKDYPGWSPYPFAMNQPIWAVDLDGLERKIVVNDNASAEHIANEYQKAINSDDVEGGMVQALGLAIAYTWTYFDGEDGYAADSHEDWSFDGTQVWRNDKMIANFPKDRPVMGLPYDGSTRSSWADPKNMFKGNLASNFGKAVRQDILMPTLKAMTGIYGAGIGAVGTSTLSFGTLTSWTINSTKDAIIDYSWQFAFQKPGNVNLISPLTNFIPFGTYGKALIKPILESSFEYSSNFGFRNSFFGNNRIGLNETIGKSFAGTFSGVLKMQYDMNVGIFGNNFLNTGADIMSEGLKQGVQKNVE
jgi:RHS repeat-associated protein